MIFSIFKNAKAQKGEICTYEKYLEVSNSPELLRLCNDIAAEEDHDKRSELKKNLPVITWQASFPGRRVAKEAVPSGLFMLDIDHIENPGEVYAKQVSSRIKELGILYVGITASRKGLRIVARCLPTLNTLEECQKWLASNLKVEYDGVCKDFARCSFVVHDSYTLYMNAGELFLGEATAIYSIDAVPAKMSGTFEAALPVNNDAFNDQTEGLFGGPTDYKGVPYEQIAHEWLLNTGGEPVQGERNARLYKLALRMRYITDFNAATLLRVMPRYGLSEEEMKGIIMSALGTNHSADMPLDLRDTLEKIDKKIKLGDNTDEEQDKIITTEKVPQLPPIFAEWYSVAPDDFKKAVTLCQLPILGALGSRLRAKYLDGRVQSPSFQVSLEAPQASGKSFLVRLVDYELAQMMESDEAARQEERKYNEKVAEMKLLNIKINENNKEEILGTKPKTVVRYIPATISITKMLQRMDAAGGLHLFAFAPEIDTVKKAFSRQFSSLSDCLRVAFDNDLYGQDYASENSFSGILPLYYNVLYSGTPKAMCRFYPDVEDGLVSRVLFVTLPDQFGKPMPIWGEFTPEQKNTVDVSLVKLNEITMQGTTVQPEHEMEMGWLNKALEKWIRAQQIEAVRLDDRTRDIFCRRAAVVGFRAGMLGYFLWDENKKSRQKVTRFAIWVANCMLNQHLLRFNIQTQQNNVNPFEKLLKELPDEFTRDDVERAATKHDIETEVKQIIYKWRLLGIIEETQQGRGKNNRKTSIKFKKIK